MLFLYLEGINLKLVFLFHPFCRKVCFLWVSVGRKHFAFLYNSKWFKNCYTQSRVILDIIKYLISVRLIFFHIFISLFYELLILSSERRLFMKHLQAKKKSLGSREFKMVWSRVGELGKPKKKPRQKKMHEHRHLYMKEAAVFPGLVNIKWIKLLFTFPLEYSSNIGVVTSRDRKLLPL